MLRFPVAEVKKRKKKAKKKKKKKEKNVHTDRLMDTFPKSG